MIKKLMSLALTASVISAVACVTLTPLAALSVHAQSARQVSAKTSSANADADAGAYRNAVLRPGNPLNDNIKAADVESLRALLKQAVDCLAAKDAAADVVGHKTEVVACAVQIKIEFVVTCFKNYGKENPDVGSPRRAASRCGLRCRRANPK